MLKEERYPVDARGKPDLRHYVDPLDYYIGMHQRYLDGLRPGRLAQPDGTSLFQLRVHALWGLIAKGGDAIAYARGLLQRAEPDAREDGAAILAELGRDDAIVARLLEALAGETDATARDAIVLALGRMKNALAVPALASILRGGNVDDDTRHVAIESLGRIAQRNFLRGEDPTAAALAWLERRRGDKGKGPPG